MQQSAAVKYLGEPLLDRHEPGVYSGLDRGSGAAVLAPVDPVAAWPLTRVLAPFLAGQDALAHAVLWDKMARVDRHSRHGHLKMAISTVDNALWDLRGRAFDAPVWQLLGGSGRVSVPAYVSTLGAPHDPAAVRALAQELAADGS